MMKKNIIALFILVSLFLSFIVHAETNECKSSKTTEIYFVNGVWNTFAQAYGGSRLLKSAYKSSLENQYEEEKFEFKVSYNYSAGKVSDLIEVIGQKMNEVTDPDVKKLTASQYMTRYMVAKEFGKAPPTIATPIAKGIEEYLAGRITDAVDSASHIQKYQADLQEGKRVLLVAHSQGNLFANQAIQSLMGKYSASIGMIGVASPAALSYNNSPYYTAHDDRVIDALRVLHTVLASNIENDPGLFNDPRDFSNHQFKDSYFEKSLLSRTKIDTDVSNYMANLQFPEAELGSGALTVTLTWGSEPDVDLHINEPNGTHIYYDNMQGVSGYLDLDDVSSYGPEHYYVSCETLEIGTYLVGVNYFEGSSTEIARIQVSTFNGNTRTFTKSLSTAVGEDGDQSPLNVATVTVTKDEEGNYSFKVN